MKVLSTILILLSANSLYAIGVGNSYVDEVGTIFKDDCSIVSDNAIRSAVIEISNLYEMLAISTDSSCSPDAVAPDLNNLMRGPVCDYLGSQKSNYDFCKPRPTDPDAAIPMDLNPYVEDVPWAKTVGALVSYTEIMIRNECFEKLLGNGQNFGHAISNILGVVQNISMATAPIEPTMASIAIGSRLGMILFSGIGAIIDAERERNRSVHPLLFSTKMCGLRKYLLNRQRAKCLTNCAGALREANQNIDCSLCEVKPAQTAFDNLSSSYQKYANILSDISNFQLTSSDQLITPEQEKTVDALVSTINSDRNLIAEKLGYESTSEFSDKYFDVIDQNDPRLNWLDYEKPSTTVNAQKDEINLIMGIPGLIIKDHLCDDPQRKLQSDEYFRDYLKFNESDTNKLCSKMELYYKCSREKSWRDSSKTECYEERTRLDNPDYSPMKSIRTSKIKDFMNAIQIQKLTQEVKSNNSACFTLEHCEQNKYNCMALLTTFDGVHSCGALTNLSSDSRQLKYLQTIKEKGYTTFHRLYLQQQIDGVKESSDYQSFLSLNFAQKELETLINTVTSQQDYDKCMEGKREHDREKNCLEEYNAMKNIAMKTINQCLFDAPTEGIPKSEANVDVTDLSWKDFFDRSIASGNLEGTVQKVLKAKKDPWEDYKEETGGNAAGIEQLEQTALSLCKTLYCPLKKLDDEETKFNLFDFYTWFGLDNPPLIRHSTGIRNKIIKKCPDIFKKEFGTIEAATPEQLQKYIELLGCHDMGCNAIIEEVLQSYHGPYGAPLDLNQCL